MILTLIVQQVRFSVLFGGELLKAATNTESSWKGSKLMQIFVECLLPLASYNLKTVYLKTSNV